MSFAPKRVACCRSSRAGFRRGGKGALVVGDPEPRRARGGLTEMRADGMLMGS